MKTTGDYVRSMLLIILVVYGGAYIGFERAETAARCPVSAKKPDLALASGGNWEMNGPYRTDNIIGSVVNNTAKTFLMVYIQFSVYDYSGAVVGTALDSTYNLGPGEVWKFKCTTYEQGALSIKLKELNGY